MTDCQIVRRSSKILFVCMQASLSIFFTINQRSPSMINLRTFFFRREGSTQLLIAFLSGCQVKAPNQLRIGKRFLARTFSVMLSCINASLSATEWFHKHKK